VNPALEAVNSIMLALSADGAYVNAASASVGAVPRTGVSSSLQLDIPRIRAKDKNNNVVFSFLCLFYCCINN